MSAIKLLNEMTREEVQAFAPYATLVLPTAAIEQHGPHLPLTTDTLIAETLARRAGLKASHDVSVCVAPVLAFGNSHHHLAYTALSLRTSTFQSVLTDLLDCIVLAGFRRIFILNAHGGNDECVKLAARDLVLKSEVAVAAGSYWSIAHSAIAEQWGCEPFPGHAGTFETALMMAIAPDLVRESLRPQDSNHPVAISNANPIEGMVMVRHGEWERIDGYSDAPLTATCARGETLLEVITSEVARAIVAVHHSLWQPN